MSFDKFMSMYGEDGTGDSNIYEKTVTDDTTTFYFPNGGEYKLTTQLLATTKNIIVKGNGNVSITITNTHEQPACIGSELNYMSYGRWNICGDACKSITIDGINVLCGDTAKCNFTVGTWNSNEVPEFKFLNGGMISCIESRYDRILNFKACPPPGSTKISERPSYALVPKGTDISDNILEYVIPGVRERIEAIAEFNSKLYDWCKENVKLSWTPTYLDAIIAYSEQCDNYDIDYAIMRFGYNENISSLLDGVICGLSEEEIRSTPIYSHQANILTECDIWHRCAMKFCKDGGINGNLRLSTENDDEVSVEEIIVALYKDIVQSGYSKSEDRNLPLLYALIPPFDFPSGCLWQFKEAVDTYYK